MMDDRLFVREIAAAVRSGASSASSVAQDVLRRRNAYDAVQPQAWIHRVAAEIVLAGAEAIDARIAAGEALPLAGVPFAVKDNIDVAGVPTTAGCPDFAYVPERSATVVERLEQAGALLIGKTNLDQFATGLAGTRSPFGTPRCVFNLDYISGGSSSGSAVVTAAGVVAFALGTDTAGSGRVPAAFNHLVGYKPSRGRWSTRGLIPACRSLDCITVFASNVSDAVQVDDVLSAFDPEDPYSRRPRNLGDARVARLGVPAMATLNFAGDRESAALFEDTIQRLDRLGCAIIEVDIAPLLAAARLLYAGPWVAERAAAMESIFQTAPDAIHPVVREIVAKGFSVSGVDAFRGQYELKAIERDALRIWQQVDALILPTAPTCYRVRELEAAPVTLNSNLGLYTNFVNLLDLSAIAMPAGFRASGTGFGVTFMAPAFADPMLHLLGNRYEDMFSMTPPPLDLNDRPPDSVQLAVVGAHLCGMPLHWQLTSRGAKPIAVTRTATAYRLFAMANSTPLKPALVRTDGDGASIEVEIYELGLAEFGSFVAEVPPPLAIGTVTLADGTDVKGFVSEPRASLGAEDITEYGGWRAYIAALT